jgi:hypothetical protein
MAEKKHDQSETKEVTEINLLVIDHAVHDWFNKKKPTVINGRKIPVMFGAWERFAQIQGNKSDKNINTMRDKKGRVKLPLISIRRGDVVPNENRYVKTDIVGEPSISFTRKLATAKFDKFQRVPFTSKWKVGATYKTSEPVNEVVRIPFPSFVNVSYNITFWSSYVNHTNEFHKKIWKEYHVKDMEYNGFFFYAHFESSSDESNLEDFTSDERIIRHSFSLQVEAYLLERDDIRIDRTVSRISFKENVVDDIDGTIFDPETSIK